MGFCIGQKNGKGPEQLIPCFEPATQRIPVVHEPEFRILYKHLRAPGSLPPTLYSLTETTENPKHKELMSR